MPWQQYVADVALELLPDGRLAYRSIIVSVPRQSGKTQLGLVIMIVRAVAVANFGGDRQVITYTAQTRNDARRKWEDEHVAQLDNSPFKRRKLYTVRKSNGSEAIKWANGSLHQIASTTEKAGHGATLDLGFIDEAFSLVDARVEQAMRPAMATRPMAQIWIVSTAGTDESFFLKAKQKIGRRAVEAGRTENIAYFEWSAPEGTDVFNCDWSFHPAVGHTQTAATLTADVEGMDQEEAERAYLNWTKGQGVSDRKIPADWWDATEVAADSVEWDGPRILCADGSPDRSSAVIAAAGPTVDGPTHGRIAAYLAGPTAALRVLRKYLEERPDDVAAIVIDPKGPLGSIIGELEASTGYDVTKVSVNDVAQACGAFHDAVKAGPTEFTHLADERLAKALDVVNTRQLASTWAWDRFPPPADDDEDTVDVAPVMALTLAAAFHRKSVTAAPVEPWAMWD